MSGYTQLPADWAAIGGVTQTLNKPTLSTVSATGKYKDMLGLPVGLDSGHHWKITTLADLVSTHGNSLQHWESGTHPTLHNTTALLSLGAYTSLTGTRALAPVATAGDRR